MAMLNVEASCSYCGNDDLYCHECDNIEDYTVPAVTPTNLVVLHEKVRWDIISTSWHRCRCDSHEGKWVLCDYHLGMQEGLSCRG